MKYIKDYKDLSQSEAWERFREEEPNDDNKFYVMIHQVMDKGSVSGQYYVEYFINVTVK